MKVIIDPYRGGNDTGKNISGQYEKNILLNLSNDMSKLFNKRGIDTELVRTNDVSLTDDERNSIINEIKNDNDIIIQNRFSEDNQFDIIYPLRNNDNLPSTISENLRSNGINIDKYFQRRLPTNTMLDYYNVIRNTKPNQTLIIEYVEGSDYNKIIELIVESVTEYINKENIYVVVSGDSLYKIANKYNISVNELKEFNNLVSNNLSIGQVLKIPKEQKTQEEEKYTTYTVQKGDSLYQIAKKYNISVNDIKKLNNLSNNLLSIGQKLKIKSENPTNNDVNEPESTNYNLYIVSSGDSLYQIAKKYNTTVDNIKKINNLTNNLLSIGQQLKVPKTTDQYEEYVVTPGDSLYQIAKKYNTTVDNIKKLNNLTSNLLSIGQILKIQR